MRTCTPIRIAMAGALVVLALASAGQAQETPAAEGRDLVSAPIPDKLEELLETALRWNPDIALAEARVREAQAELNQARLKTAQRVATLYYEWKKQQQVKAELTKENKRIQQGYGVGRISFQELSVASLAQAEADAKLFQLEAEIRYVLGRGSVLPITFSEESAERTPPARAPRRPPIPDHQRKSLLQTLIVNWQEATLDTVLKELEAATGGELTFLLGPGLRPETAAARIVTLPIKKEIEVGDAMLALTDHLAEYKLCFVFREYGVILTATSTAAEMLAPTLPANVPLRGRK